jgi:ADP-ribosylglycohydrolase
MSPNLVKDTNRVLAGFLVPAASIDAAAEVYGALVVFTHNHSFSVFVVVILADAALTHLMITSFLEP